MQCRSNSTLNIMTNSALWASISITIAMTVTTAKMLSNILVLIMCMTIIVTLFVYKQIDVNGDQYAGEAMAVTTGIRLAYNVSTGSLSPLWWCYSHWPLRDDRGILCSLYGKNGLFWFSFSGQTCALWFAFVGPKMLYFDFPFAAPKCCTLISLLRPQNAVHFDFPFATPKCCTLISLLRDKKCVLWFAFERQWL